MDPVTLVQNAYALVQSLLLPLGGLVLVAGIALWALAKPLDSPRMSSIGTKSMIGGVALGASPSVIALLQTIGTRIGFVHAGGFIIPVLVA